MSESALDRAVEAAKILRRQADRAEADLLKANDELAALRRRNEKLERVVALVRRLPGRRVGQTPYIVLLNEILVELRALDKED